MLDLWLLEPSLALGVFVEVEDLGKENEFWS
jgi:hypothetical protein